MYYQKTILLYRYKHQDVEHFQTVACNKDKNMTNEIILCKVTEETMSPNLDKQYFQPGLTFMDKS